MTRNLLFATAIVIGSMHSAGAGSLWDQGTPLPAIENYCTDPADLPTGHDEDHSLDYGKGPYASLTWGQVVTPAMTGGGVPDRGCFPKQNLCYNKADYFVAGQHWSVTVTEHADTGIMCRRYVCSYNRTGDVAHCVNFDTGRSFTLIADHDGVLWQTERER